MASKGGRHEGCGCGLDRAVLGVFVGMGMLCLLTGIGVDVLVVRLCSSFGQCFHGGIE